jgi:ABC-type sulfate/molybdate transport systems ATPase subunit
MRNHRRFTQRRSVVLAAPGLSRVLVFDARVGTHDLEETAALADHVVIPHRGRTRQEGPRGMSRPVSAGVARLVDVRNVFDGREFVGHPA